MEAPVWLTTVATVHLDGLEIVVMKVHMYILYLHMNLTLSVARLASISYNEASMSTACMQES